MPGLSAGASGGCVATPAITNGPYFMVNHGSSLRYAAITKEGWVSKLAIVVAKEARPPPSTWGYKSSMTRFSTYAAALAGFSLAPSPPAYVQRILDAGPETDLYALISDMNGAYRHLSADVEGAEQAEETHATREARTRASASKTELDKSDV